MSKYYSVAILARFGVLANSQEEADELALKLAPSDSEWPARAVVTVDASLTTNQDDRIKRYAANYKPT